MNTNRRYDVVVLDVDVVSLAWLGVCCETGSDRQLTTTKRHNGRPKQLMEQNVESFKTNTTKVKICKKQHFLKLTMKQCFKNNYIKVWQLSYC